jgi:hypothetical protein
MACVQMLQCAAASVCFFPVVCVEWCVDHCMYNRAGAKHQNQKQVRAGLSRTLLPFPQLHAQVTCACITIVEHL